MIGGSTCLVLEANRKWHHCHTTYGLIMLWYKHVACVVHASSALAIGMKMGEKHKSATPSAMQVKN